MPLRMANIQKEHGIWVAKWCCCFSRLFHPGLEHRPARGVNHRACRGSTNCWLACPNRKPKVTTAAALHLYNGWTLKCDSLDGTLYLPRMNFIYHLGSPKCQSEFTMPTILPDRRAQHLGDTTSKIFTDQTRCPSGTDAPPPQ